MYDIDDKESAIRSVQRFLLELHYDTGEIPFVTIDGIYGPATRAAVAAYQRLRSLPETGEVDYATWQSLFRDYTAALAAREGAATVPPDTPLPVRIGASGEGVENLQRLMNYLAEQYGLALRTDVSGVYSYSTEQLANALRAIYRLPEDGTVTSEFYDKMVRDYNNPMTSFE